MIRFISFSCVSSKCKALLQVTFPIIGGLARASVIATDSKFEPKDYLYEDTKMDDNQHPLPWLLSYCPEFPIAGENVQILKEPSEFFEKLKDLTKTATSRITLASLYIGTGNLEKELVECLHNKLACSNPEFKIQVLIDCTRGSRGKDNSRKLLLPLLKLFPSKMQISLYHTPKLRGLLKWILPERWNETIGLTHLKVYLFDNTLMLSGANLSDQYFINRQDRYVLFHDCKELADYFHNLVSTISTFSLQLQTDNSLALHPSWKIHPFYGNYAEFVKKANQALQDFVVPTCLESLQRRHENSTCDTLVYPLLQMHNLGITQERQVVQKLLQKAESDSSIKLASGYFNLTRHYMNIILQTSNASYDLLVASPKVNGFYGASGVAGAIPMVYTHIAKKFFQRILSFQQQERIKLCEYERDDWTFHVKGLWYYKPTEKLPCVSLIGSPNFGYRSVYKDLEAQVAIVTTNEALQKDLHEEQDRLYQRTTPVDVDTFNRADRKVPTWVKVVTYLIQHFF